MDYFISQAEVKGVDVNKMINDLLKTRNESRSFLS